MLLVSIPLLWYVLKLSICDNVLEFIWALYSLDQADWNYKFSGMTLLFVVWIIKLCELMLDWHLILVQFKPKWLFWPYLILYSIPIKKISSALSLIWRGCMQHLQSYTGVYPKIISAMPKITSIRFERQ